MNKQEAIKLIEKLEEHYGISEGVYLKKRDVINIISQIDEQQKPVVSKFVAEWIEEGKRSGWHLQKALSRLDDDEKVGDWAYDENDDLIPEKVDMIARAWLAYPNITIEQEKLYTVEIPNPNGDSNGYGLCRIDGKIIVGSFAFGLDRANNAKLTESEIKQDFDFLRQFAKEVEGWSKH